MLGRKREKEAVPRIWWNGPVDYPFENTTIPMMIVNIKK